MRTVSGRLKIGSPQRCDPDQVSRSAHQPLRYGAKVHWNREHQSEIVRSGVGPHANAASSAHGATASRAAADMWGAIPGH
jgi:hypothetical protein